ncbi:hypothetical protein PENTCL1PPCAC_14743, partial [Pristionchus entomophagus]
AKIVFFFLLIAFVSFSVVEAQWGRGGGWGGRGSHSHERGGWGRGGHRGSSSHSHERRWGR